MLSVDPALLSCSAIWPSSCFSNILPWWIVFFFSPNFNACRPIPQCWSIDQMQAYYSSLPMKFSTSTLSIMLPFSLCHIFRSFWRFQYLTIKIRLLNLTILTIFRCFRWITRTKKTRRCIQTWLLSLHWPSLLYLSLSGCMIVLIMYWRQYFQAQTDLNYKSTY